MAHTSEDVQSVQVLETENDGSSQGNQQVFNTPVTLAELTVVILHKVLKSQMNALMGQHAEVKGQIISSRIKIPLKYIMFIIEPWKLKTLESSNAVLLNLDHPTPSYQGFRMIRNRTITKDEALTVQCSFKQSNDTWGKYGRDRWTTKLGALTMRSKIIQIILWSLCLLLATTTDTTLLFVPKSRQVQGVCPSTTKNWRFGHATPTIS